MICFQKILPLLESTDVNKSHPQLSNWYHININTMMFGDSGSTRPSAPSSTELDEFCNNPVMMEVKVHHEKDCLGEGASRYYFVTVPGMKLQTLGQFFNKNTRTELNLEQTPPLPISNREVKHHLAELVLR